MKKILKIFKWLFILFIIGVIIFFGYWYYSKINLYKYSDFNISKNFFDTKYEKKALESDKNGFKDYVKYIESFNFKHLNNNKLEKEIGKINYISSDNYNMLNYFEILYKCNLEKNEKYKYDEKKCKKELDRFFDELLREYDKEIEKEYIKGKQEKLSKEELDKILEKKYIKVDSKKIRIIKDFNSYYIKKKKTIDGGINKNEDKIKNLDKNDGFLEDHYFEYINTKESLYRYKNLIEDISTKYSEIDSIAKLAEFIDKVNEKIEKIDKEKIEFIEKKLQKYVYKDLKISDFKVYLDGINNFQNKIRKNLIKKYYRKIYVFIRLNQLKEQKIQKKEYIKIPVKINNFYVVSGLLKYNRVLNYISDYYIKNGKVNKGINILLENQKLNDYLYNHLEASLMHSLALLSINSYNLKSFKNILANKKIDNKYYKKIKDILEKKLYKEFFINTFKYERKIKKELFKIVLSNYDESETITNIKTGEKIKKLKPIIERVKLKLFFDEEDFYTIINKIDYDNILNSFRGSKWYEEKFVDYKTKDGRIIKIFPLTLADNVGRKLLITNNIEIYYKQCKKFDDYMKKREELVKNTKINH